MKNKIWIVILLVLCAYIPSMAFAETVVLKSGKIIEGKLLEKTDKYIKIDFEGVVLTYFLDEIAQIDEGKKVGSALSEDNPIIPIDEGKKVGSALSEDNSNKQEAQAEESDIPTVILKEGPASIQQINKAYYNLTQQGFQQFKCEVTSNDFDAFKDRLKLKYPSTDLKRQMLDSVKLYLTFNNEGKVNLDYVPFTKIEDAQIDDTINKYIEYMRNTLKSFFDIWTMYVIDANVLEPDFNFTIEKLPSGYTLSCKDMVDGRSIKIQIDSKLRISERVVSFGGTISKVIPHFINSKHGLLLQSFDGDINGAMKISATMSYQEVDGLQMLKQATIKTTLLGKQGNVEIKFFDYKIKKIP